MINLEIDDSKCFGRHIHIGDKKVQCIIIPEFNFYEWIRKEGNKEEFKKQLDMLNKDLKEFIDNGIKQGV